MKLSHWLLSSVFYSYSVRGNDISKEIVVRNSDGLENISRITKENKTKAPKAPKALKAPKAPKAPKAGAKSLKKTKSGNHGKCQIKQVESVLNAKGELVERIFYIPDESCEIIPSCKSKSSDISLCQETTSGECVCEATCIAKSTLTSTCKENSLGCICAEPWIMNMFSQGDANEDGKISKRETLNFYERTGCVESFVVDGFTYKECTTEGYPEDTADLEKFPWCSTKVDSAGAHIDGFFKFCGQQGFSNEWDKALEFDSNKDKMLSIDEVIAFEDAFYGSSRMLPDERQQPEIIRALRQQFNDAHVIDLDKDFATNSLFNRSSGALRVKKAFKAFNKMEHGDELLSVMVIENGIKVVEFYNEDRGVTADSEIYMWSATKTVMSLLIGQMLKEYSNNISYGSTMAEIFTEGAKTCKLGSWPFDYEVECFHKQAEKKKMTLIQLLTMTSGSHDCIDDVFFGAEDLGSLGGVGVKDSFHSTYYKESFFISACDDYYGKCYEGLETCSAEEYHYTLANNVLSYVVKRITDMNPQDYFKTKLTKQLGIHEEDYTWCTNDEGVGHALHGLKMTTPGMAKIGQFYLQQGRTKIGNQESDIVTKEYMDDLHFNKLVKKYVEYENEHLHNYTTDDECRPGNYDG